MKEIKEEFVENQVEQLKEREDVRAIAVVGSYARNPEGDHNDLDLYIVVEGEWRKRDTEEIEGVVVEKFFNSMEWARHYFERDKENYYMIQWMENVDVRHDPENVFGDLKDLAAERKEDVLDVDEERVLYNVWDRKKELERIEDVGQKRFFMYSFLEYLLKVDYRVRGKIPVKDNYLIENLESFDGYMYKLAQEFLNSSSTYEKEEKLEKMIQHVTKDIGRPSPEYSTSKEFFS